MILKTNICMLKKISQNCFLIFYHLQQTPTWVVHKNSNHQPGFHIKHENAATTHLKHITAITYQIQFFPMIFSTKCSFLFCSKHLPEKEMKGEKAATTHLETYPKNQLLRNLFLYHIQGGDCCILCFISGPSYTPSCIIAVLPFLHSGFISWAFLSKKLKLNLKLNSKA